MDNRLAHRLDALASTFSSLGNRLALISRTTQEDFENYNAMLAERQRTREQATRDAVMRERAEALKRARNLCCHAHRTVLVDISDPYGTPGKRSLWRCDDCGAVRGDGLVGAYGQPRAWCGPQELLSDLQYSRLEPLVSWRAQEALRNED